MIKTTYLHYSYHTKCFRKYIAENGNFICSVDGVILSKDEGNKIYKELREKYPDSTADVVISHENNEEIIESIEKGIDKYVEYIDDYKRYFYVKARNERLYNIINEFRAIC